MPKNICLMSNNSSRHESGSPSTASGNGHEETDKESQAGPNKYPKAVAVTDVGPEALGAVLLINNKAVRAMRGKVTKQCGKEFEFLKPLGGM